ncbi:hypothetical protein NI17_019650 [Thermobifida halotolerans]|uniref:Uncharacterized protein n=1 Tax=Thermobifida halotolerans TaxID=483545 RepID=A0A399FZ15_9ACTN|nr:hypothetical protein [Thermobifida halotolerans]UOE18956.1 hypothetical protein NI17_019650 [Thermobifida halotolerans]
MVVMILPLKVDAIPSTAGAVYGAWPYATAEPAFPRIVQATRAPYVGAVTTNPDDDDEEDDGGPEWLRPPRTL